MSSECEPDPKPESRKRLIAPGVSVLTKNQLTHYKGLPPGYHYTNHMYRMPNLQPLTATQLAVMQMIAEGHTYNEIARAFKMNHSTVKNHIYEIFDRLEARNQAHAVLIAMRKGLLQ